MERKLPTTESMLRYLPSALRRLRRSKGFGQEDLAKRSGLGKATISRYETGEGSPSIVNLMKILDALGASDEELLRELSAIQNEEEGDSSEPFRLPANAPSLEDRLLAIWVRSVARGQGETWLEQMDAAITRIKAVYRLTQAKEDEAVPETGEKPQPGEKSGNGTEAPG
jgi:transcriptional regulator with XRE-family HTH domain